MAGNSSAERGLGVQVDRVVTRSQQCVCPGSQALLGFIKSSITSQSKEALILLYSVLMWLQLECCVQCLASQIKKDVEGLWMHPEEGNKVGERVGRHFL